MFVLKSLMVNGFYYLSFFYLPNKSIIGLDPFMDNTTQRYCIAIERKTKSCL